MKANMDKGIYPGGKKIRLWLSKTKKDTCELDFIWSAWNMPSWQSHRCWVLLCQILSLLTDCRLFYFFISLIASFKRFWKGHNELKSTIYTAALLRKGPYFVIRSFYCENMPRTGFSFREQCQNITQTLYTVSRKCHCQVMDEKDKVNT